MGFLCEELKNPVNVTIALKNNILAVLVEALVNSLSFLYPTLIRNLLELLKILSLNMNAAADIASDDVLMKNLMKLISDLHYEQYSLLAADILLSISIFPSGMKQSRDSANSIYL